MTATLSEFDHIVAQLVARNVPRHKAEEAARLELKLPRREPLPNPATVARLEKEIEHEGDVMMQKLGFEVIRFSHPGKTQQTPGIPDRRYYRRPRDPMNGGPGTAPNKRSEALVVWVEFKSANGRQRPGQKLFQELAEACGEAYVLGGLVELTAWLRRSL